MNETRPRYVATFRAGTPELVVVSVLVVLGAAFAVGVSRIAQGYACDEVSGDCGADRLARVQLIVAGAGLVSALGMLVASGRTRGHPWRWFLATVLIYIAWAALFRELVQG